MSVIGCYGESKAVVLNYPSLDRLLEPNKDQFLQLNSREPVK